MSPHAGTSQKKRVLRGPVIIALLILLAACGISVDFFVTQYQASQSADDTRFPASVTPMQQSPLPSQQSELTNLEALTKNVSAGEAESADAMTTVSDPVSPSMERSISSAEYSQNVEALPVKIKVSEEPFRWNGKAQLLPNPLFVRDRIEIRGGGWLIIDVAHSEIVPVELFKSRQSEAGGRSMVEAQYPNGKSAVNPNHAGFPIVRGLSSVKPGRFEVFENPPCLVRAMNVNEMEDCAVVVGAETFKFRFVPAPPGVDLPMAEVFFDVGVNRWVKIASFNESFHPIGDPNRDGVPDFYVETVTGQDESGHHELLLSQRQGEDITYQRLMAAFKSHR